MKTMVSREVRIVDAFKVFPDTIAIYQNAVSFLIDVVNEHYANVCGLPSQKAMTFIERLVHSTSTRKALYPSFDTRFHKLPPAFISFRHISAVRRSWRRLPPSRSTGRTSLTGRLPTSRGGSLASTGGAT